MRRLVIAFHQDPLDPRTWSRTPLNLAESICEEGWDVAGLVTAPPPRVQRALRRLHRRANWGPDWRRGPLMRRAAAASYQRRVGALRADVVLHIGTLHLPLLPGGRRGMVQTCFIDTTWSLSAAHRSSIDRYPPSMWRSAEALERRAYRQMDHVFVASRRACHELIEHYGIDPARVTVVGTGLGQPLPTIASEAASDRATPPRLLFVAKNRLVDKGLDVLLEAFAVVRAKWPDALLTLVGPSIEQVEVPLRDGVEARSWVEADELAQLYVDADLFVLPARSEPWGLVYLEALSYGTPILGVDRHAFAELAGDGKYGIIVEEPDPRLVAKAIDDALRDRALLARMGQEGREHVSATARWPLVARSITRTLESL